MSMPRAKLSFAQRLLIETMLKANVSQENICIHLGIASVQLQMELRRGRVSKKGDYDPIKAQLSLVA